MKRFIFTLEKVLEVKKMEENSIQKQLMSIQASIYEVEKKIISLAEKISRERGKITVKKDAKVKSNEIMTHYNYIESLSVQKESLYIDLENLKSEELKVRAKLVEKSKERKALEIMKENKYEEYKKEYKKEQQILYDEISITNHRLRQGASS